MSGHYLNQCWYIVNWAPRNRRQWNLNRNLNIFTQENAFENVVWKMAAILSRPHCANTKMDRPRTSGFPEYGVHYSDVIMDAIASQIAILTIVYPTVYSSVDQRKHESSASLAFVRGIHRWPVNFPHKGPVTRKMLPFDDVIIICIIEHGRHGRPMAAISGKLHINSCKTIEQQIHILKICSIYHGVRQSLKTRVLATVHWNWQLACIFCL